MGKRGPKRNEMKRLLVRTLLDVMTLQEIADGLGVSRQRIQQIAGKGYARFQGQRPRWVPHWELPTRADKHHIAALCDLGMTVKDATEFVGYKWLGHGSPRNVSGRHRALGSRKDDDTWKGWKVRWDRELRKLVAKDAILKGATYREAAMVSGLSWNSISAWVSMGKLPRSRYRQGFGYPVLRALEQSDGASTEEKPR